jgi:hypothetical protein
VFLFVYPDADALAFTTRDPGLIRVLNIVFNDKFNKGVPVHALAAREANRPSQPGAAGA